MNKARSLNKHGERALRSGCSASRPLAMKGSVIPVHRRPGSAGGGSAAAAPARAASPARSALSVFLPDNSTSHLGFANPWEPAAGAGAARPRRPASASVRRPINDHGLSLVGTNKAAAEINSAVRPASARVGGRGASGGGDAGGGGPGAAGGQVEDYVPVKKLGQGASGSVYLAQYKLDSSYWVLKQVELGRSGSAPSVERNGAIARAERDNVLREVKLMSTIKSEHLIRYCTSFLHQAAGGPQSVFIVMEYAENGTLADYIKQLRSTASKADQMFVWKCMLQVCSGLAAIHAHRVIHRDMKSANILVTGNQNFKIADLGIAVSTSLCNVQGRLRTGRCGTVSYMAPEVSNDMPYDARADMWSLGCVLYEVCCHRVPFPSGTAVDTGVRVESGISMQSIVQHAAELQLPHAYSDSLNNHVLWCLAVEPVGRPAARELLSTKDSVVKAVELRISLAQGFQYPADEEERVEYRQSTPAAKRRSGRSRDAGSLGARPPSAAAVTQEAWAQECDDLNELGLSPIQGSPNQAGEEANGKGKARRGSRPQSGGIRPQSARLASGASGPGKPLASRLRPASAASRSFRAREGVGDTRSDLGVDRGAYEAWQTGTEPLHLDAVDDADEEDLPENLRSKDQALWERTNVDLLRQLPGWQQDAGATGDRRGATYDKINLRSVGPKAKKKKKLTKEEKLVAAGSQRRMVKAVCAALQRGSAKLDKLALLLEAQVGMPLEKMLHNAGTDGAALSLVDFLLAHPKHFTLSAGDEVSLRGAEINAGNLQGDASSASARILQGILSKPVRVGSRC